MSAKAPGLSTPAAVTTASSTPPAPSTAACTAASAARGSARSTSSNANPSAGCCRSRTSGVPPAAATASATAAPSPDAPPVTSTVPMSAGIGQRPLDQGGRRAALEARHEYHLAAPLSEHRGLLELAARVVGTLHEQVRPQPVERRGGRRLVE